MPTFTALTTLTGRDPAYALGEAMERLIPEPTGVGGSAHQGRTGDPAHPRLHDRVVDTEQHGRPRLQTRVDHRIGLSHGRHTRAGIVPQTPRSRREEVIP